MRHTINPAEHVPQRRILAQTLAAAENVPALYKLRPSARYTVYVSPGPSRDNLAPGVLLVDAEPLSCWDLPSSSESWPPLYY